MSARLFTINVAIHGPELKLVVLDKTGNYERSNKGKSRLRNFLTVLGQIMGISSVIYNSIFKRTSTMAVAIITSAFFFERAYDQATDYIFETINEGKLWKHIKDKY